MISVQVILSAVCLHLLRHRPIATTPTTLSGGYSVIIPIPSKVPRLPHAPPTHPEDMRGCECAFPSQFLLFPRVAICWPNDFYPHHPCCCCSLVLLFAGQTIFTLITTVAAAAVAALTLLLLWFMSCS